MTLGAGGVVPDHAVNQSDSERVDDPSVFVAVDAEVVDGIDDEVRLEESVVGAWGHEGCAADDRRGVSIGQRCGRRSELGTRRRGDERREESGHAYEEGASGHVRNLPVRLGST